MKPINSDSTNPRAERVEVLTLPIIDLAPSSGKDAAARLNLVESIRRAAEERGFFYLVNHRVPIELMQEVVTQARRFFAMDDAAKRAIHAKHPSGLGYGLMGGKTLHGGFGANVKEEFYYSRDDVPGMTEHNQWPKQLSGFREPLVLYIEKMLVLAEQMMRLLAESIGLPADHFATFCTDPLATVRLVRYPPQGAEAGAHTDFGALTFLLQDTMRGLQVFDKATGGWIHAEPIPGSFIVNLGDLFEVWTNNAYKSTLHRVVHPAGEDRISVPFFYTGAATCRVECLPQFLKSGENPAHGPTTPAGHLRDGHEAQGF
jgi:isopenicillin N synthase-like dioxygenase